MRKLFSSSGFTLLEILIAMAIFTLIGLASTGVMTSVIDSNELSENRFDKLQALQRTMLTIERDLLQIVPRAIRLEYEQNDIVISGDKNNYDSEFYGLGFVRAGWQNPQLMLHRSTLQAVAYRVMEGRLERLYGNYVDNVAGYEPKVRVLMENIEDFQVRFLFDTEEDKNDLDNWQESASSTTLPAAISIIIISKEFGEIRRDFLTSLGGS